VVSVRPGTFGVMRIRRPARVGAISPAGGRVPGLSRLPGNFLDELADELDASLQEAIRQAERLAILAELLRAATATARQLRRPVTVWDVIESADEQSERDRLTELVKRLRA
jgi:hypothetical protein